MIRILHLADLHLGWRPGFLGPRAAERQRERDTLLRRAVDFALASQPVDLVIIAGDLFETHKPEPALVEAVIADLGRLARAGVAVVTVPGNHDEITYADSVYRVYASHWPGVLVQNPHPAHVHTFVLNGTPVHVYGLAYTGGLTQVEPPLARFPRLDEDGIHIAVFHGSLDWQAGERSLPLRSDALAAAGYDYVALGHIHKPERRRIGAGWAVYPGAVEGKGFDDPGVGCFTVVTVDKPGGGPARVEVATFPAGARPVRTITLDVTTLADADAVVERIRAEAEARAGREAIVRVELVGAAPGVLDVGALTARLSGSFYFLEIVDNTTIVDAAHVARLAAEPTVRGEFVRRMQRRLAEAADEEESALLAQVLRCGLAALEGAGS